MNLDRLAEACPVKVDSLLLHAVICSSSKGPARVPPAAGGGSGGEGSDGDGPESSLTGGGSEGEEAYYLSDGDSLDDDAMAALDGSDASVCGPSFQSILLASL